MYIEELNQLRLVVEKHSCYDDNPNFYSKDASRLDAFMFNWGYDHLNEYNHYDFSL